MNKKGFTLIELLAVIAILGVLATIAVTSIIKIYNDSVKKTMIVQENNIASVSKNYLEDYCFDPLDGSYNCPKSYDNNTNNRYICLSDLQENEKDNYINKVTYKNEDCKGIIVFSKDDDGEYTKAKTYLYCDYDSRNNKYNYITDETLDTSLYPRCDISSGILPGGDDTTTTSTTTTKPVDTACTYNGELVQGTTFVSGQYTYKYKQEGGFSSSTDLKWDNITTDGWGVQLTDKESTDAVTSKLCSSINGKPIVSMTSMFNGSQASSIDFSSFDTSNVTNMYNMFRECKTKILDLSNFNTSKVTKMYSMFNLSEATTIDVSKFDTSKVTDMSFMFSESLVTKLDVSNFDTSNVTDMSAMFNDVLAPTIDVSGFNTSKVTKMSFMFSGTNAKILDVSKFDTSKVTNMIAMFQASSATVLDVSKFNTSKVTNMSSMFHGSDVKSLNLSNFNTSNVTDMSSMFGKIKLNTLDLSSFDTSKVTTMSFMFRESTNLKTIYVSDKFNTDSVKFSTEMFDKSTNLVGGMGTKYNSNYIDDTYARIDNCDNPGYFSDKNFTLSGNFSTDSWSKIISNVRNGKSCIYKVGDTKTIDMGSYGTHTVRIANISTPSVCSTSGFSQTACGFVLEFADIIEQHVINPVGTYKGTYYKYGWNKDGWPATSMRTYVNSDIYNALPSALKSGIINTTVVSSYGSYDSSNFTSTDKLYLLSPGEVFTNWTDQYDKARSLTRTLDYYTSKGTTTNSCSAAIKKKGTTAMSWFTRSAGYNNEDCFFGISYSCRYDFPNASSDYGVSPAFRIG